MDEHDPQSPTEGGGTTPPTSPPEPSGEMPPASPPSAGGDLPATPAPGSEWGASQPKGTPLPMGEPAKKNNMPLFVGIGVIALAVIAAVAVFALKKDGGGDFPETLGGVARSHSQQAQQFETQFSQQSFEGMTAKVALYGSDTSPSHLAMVFDNVPAALKGQSLAPFLDQFATSFAGSSGASLDTSQSLNQTIDGVNYLCIPISGSTTTGSVCVFNGSKLGALVTLTTSDPQTALGLAQQVSDAVQ